MIVTIVARTRMGRGSCIGAITEDGRSVRLVASDADFNEHFNADYRVGEVWEIEGDPPPEIIPPHTENIVVWRKRKLGWAENLDELIERAMPPRVGGLDTLHDGLAQGKPGGPLYIAQRTGVPSFSTMFWRPDKPLTRDTSGKRIRYLYPTEDGGRTLTFTGYQEPPPELPAGSLLRVSLAHWWRPRERPDEEVRCYMQLSGWIPPGGPPQDEADYEDEPAGEAAHAAPRPQATLDDARRALKEVFGYDEFRPLQSEIIGNVLSRRDSLVVMPTGSGKSMCFQLPALLFPGLTVVVSPLISLMEDQVAQLRQLGVPAAFLNSTLAYDGYVAITRQIRAGQIKLLYASPETLLRPETLLMLEDCRVDCLTIDEAHCISEWGHDFRPEYRQLLAARERLPEAVCLAVTATATERVRRDIKQTLAVRDADQFIASFNRPNLFLAVEPRTSGVGQVLEFLESRRGESGIIYCATRARTEEIAEQLSRQGWNALPYHAGQEYATRLEHQRRFTHEEGVIIVATIAFGMGINKSNVRFVVHFGLPKDLENYYQQIGRAGRDGLPADCLLLFSPQDVMLINRHADKAAPEQRAAAAARLQAMVAFAETDTCRRRPLLSYFGESDIPDTCGQCDNCQNSVERRMVDLTVPAQKFLSCVARTGQVFGAGYLSDVLRGSQRQEILERGHDKLSTYGIGREFNRKEWQQLARQLVSNGLLQQDMEYGGLQVTDKGRAVMRGETYMGIAPSAPQKTRRAAETADYDAELFERLRSLRTELARDAAVPPYVVFSDASLRDMAVFYPQSRQAFSQVQGVGAHKLERYGEDFLAIIIDYCGERGLQEVPRKATMPLPLERPKTRRNEIVALNRRGLTVTEIAEQFGVQPSTVRTYLWEALRDGEALAADNLLAESKLPEAEAQRVFAAFDELGVERLRPVFDALGEAVSFEELHYLRLYHVARAMEA